ncbi:MAG TPA: DUF5668 domain-containing protein, partial [Candidatus Dormibacteraeota bacterium]|nr:DUF5668 domain-containing protein [Candidatus Dormibacteraeota bacterium]
IPGAAPAATPGAAVPPPGALPASAATPHPGGSPGVAFVLGLFPGLGAVYNGEYNKALIHIVVFVAMIVGLNSDPGDAAATVLSLLLAGFILYMAFDAMRVAKARNLGETPPDPLENWSKNRPVGPIILIVLGVLFLLNNFNWLPFWRIGRLWPLVLVGVGVLMFRNRLERRP